MSVLVVILAHLVACQAAGEPRNLSCQIPHAQGSSNGSEFQDRADDVAVRVSRADPQRWEVREVERMRLLLDETDIEVGYFVVVFHNCSEQSVARPPVLGWVGEAPTIRFDEIDLIPQEVADLYPNNEEIVREAQSLTTRLSVGADGWLSPNDPTEVLMMTGDRWREMERVTIEDPSLSPYL